MGTRPKIWGGGKRAKTAFFFCVALASHSSSTTIFCFFPFIPHNKFLHPPTMSLLLSKLTLAPATYSYLATASFTATMSRRLDTKTVISSANAEILARTLPLRKIPHRAGRATPSEDIEETRGSLAGPTARSQKPPNTSR